MGWQLACLGDNAFHATRSEARCPPAGAQLCCWRTGFKQACRLCPRPLRFNNRSEGGRRNNSQPRAAAMNASAMPVLPEVGSTRVVCTQGGRAGAVVVVQQQEGRPSRQPEAVSTGVILPARRRRLLSQRRPCNASPPFLWGQLAATTQACLSPLPQTPFQRSPSRPAGPPQSVLRPASAASSAPLFPPSTTQPPLCPTPPPASAARTLPGAILPAASASAIMEYPMRSLTEQQGSMISSLAATRAAAAHSARSVCRSVSCT